MKRMILDMDGFNALITHIQDLNYEVRETPQESGVVLNEIVSEDGAVVGTFKTYEGGIPFDEGERAALVSAIEALEESGCNVELVALSKKFPGLFSKYRPMLKKNKARATRVADLIAGYPDTPGQGVDEMLGVFDETITTASDVIADCCHLAQHVTESESAQMLPEDREYMNELVVVHVLDNSFTVRRSLAQMLFRGLNNYEAESQGEE